MRLGRFGGTGRRMIKVFVTFIYLSRGVLFTVVNEVPRGKRLLGGISRVLPFNLFYCAKSIQVCIYDVVYKTVKYVLSVIKVHTY